MFKDLIQVLNPQLPIYLECGSFVCFFIENVHLKNTKEFTLYSDNTEREKKKEE